MHFNPIALPKKINSNDACAFKFIDGAIFATVLKWTWFFHAGNRSIPRQSTFVSSFSRTTWTSALEIWFAIADGGLNGTRVLSLVPNWSIGSSWSDWRTIARKPFVMDATYCQDASYGIFIMNITSTISRTSTLSCRQIVETPQLL